MTMSVRAHRRRRRQARIMVGGWVAESGLNNDVGHNCIPGGILRVVFGVADE